MDDYATKYAAVIEWFRQNFVFVPASKVTRYKRIYLNYFRTILIKSFPEFGKTFNLVSWAFAPFVSSRIDTRICFITDANGGSGSYMSNFILACDIDNRVIKCTVIGKSFIIRNSIPGFTVAMLRSQLATRLCDSAITTMHSTRYPDNWIVNDGESITFLPPFTGYKDFNTDGTNSERESDCGTPQ